MNGSSPQLAREEKKREEKKVWKQKKKMSGDPMKGRSPLAHLLHALNQPLTGLQCSLELAAAGPRSHEQHVRTVREGLELTGRMRLLVEAIRELSELQPAEADDGESLALETLLRATVDDLLPVAESKRIRMIVTSGEALPVRGQRQQLTGLLFRVLECGLSLAREGGEMRVAAAREGDRTALRVSWIEGPPPAHSPFSPAELGLLIAQAAWEQAGAEWTWQREQERQSCTIRLPLAYAARDHTQDDHAQDNQFQRERS